MSSFYLKPLPTYLECRDDPFDLFRPERDQFNISEPKRVPSSRLKPWNINLQLIRERNQSVHRPARSELAESTIRRTSTDGFGEQKRLLRDSKSITQSKTISTLNDPDDDSLTKLLKKSLSLSRYKDCDDTSLKTFQSVHRPTRSELVEQTLQRTSADGFGDQTRLLRDSKPITQWRAISTLSDDNDDDNLMKLLKKGLSLSRYKDCDDTSLKTLNSSSKRFQCDISPEKGRSAFKFSAITRTPKSDPTVDFYHYTDYTGYTGIKSAGYIRESNRDWMHARYGRGVYGTKLDPSFGKQKIAWNNWRGGRESNRRRGRADYAVKIHVPKSRITEHVDRGRHIYAHPGVLYLKEYEHQFISVP